MGGSSGILTATFFKAASMSYGAPSQFRGEDRWRSAFVAGTNAVMMDGKAKIGDRTMVDALKPAADVLNQPGTNVAQAAQAARIGCESTKLMLRARFGRSSFIPSSALINHPDPGAMAVCYVLEALVDAIMV